LLFILSAAVIGQEESEAAAKNAAAGAKSIPHVTAPTGPPSAPQADISKAAGPAAVASEVVAKPGSGVGK
jgi:hypothetical protein